jgi:hypothetical protein
VDRVELAVGVGGEGGDDGEGGGGVDVELGPAAVVVVLLDAVGVPGAAILVADALELAVLALALVETSDVARVGGDVDGA